MTPLAYADRHEPMLFTLRGIVDAWRHITRAQIKAAFLFGCAVFVYHVIVWSYGMLNRPSLIYPLVATFVHDQIGAFTLMLAIVVADRSTTRYAHERAPYVIAVVVSSIVMAPLGTIFATWFLSEFSWNNVLAGTTYMFFEWLVMGGAATFIYIDRRRAHVALARMHAAQLERAHTAKRALESRLQAMQARVEPQFLFNTLAQVKLLYRSDALQAERMLADLIAYLRAAMPLMRDTSSTVGQEIMLVRAYLDIVKIPLRDRLAFEIDIAAGASDARMPAMTLLPLIDHAINGANESRSKRSIGIAAGINHDRLTLTISESGSAFAAEMAGGGIASIRERLAALYGHAGTLELRLNRAHGTEANLEIPYERVATSGADAPPSVEYSGTPEPRLA